MYFSIIKQIKGAAWLRRCAFVGGMGRGYLVFEVLESSKPQLRPSYWLRSFDMV